MSVGQGNVDQTMKQGNIIYGKAPDGHFYPMQVNSSGEAKLQQREYFIFRPGSAALANGMVPSGTRSAGGTITTAASADVTYWGTEVVYAPLRSGKIDGIAASGIVSGQITIGHKSAAGTVNVKVTLRGRNTTGASTATTVLLALQAATAVTTAETYATYDIPYLLTVADFNQVPFGIQLGIQTAVAASAGIGRIMESSYVDGYFEPGT